MEAYKGAIWDSVQSEALEAIPEGVEADLGKIMTFYNWREKGGYLVTGSTKKDFLLSCSARELGGVLLKETTTLHNQALEHRAIIGSALVSGKTLSSSWLLVTTYYWCVYLALSWLRMTGQIVTYLPSNEIQRFNKLNSGTGNSPTNGTFTTTIEKEYGSKRDIKLRKLSSNNFHEGLWSAFNADITERIKLIKDEPAGMELRIFSCLDLKRYADGHSWPSKIRNAINYKVGFGYGELEGLRKPDLITPGNAIKNMTTSEIISNHEKNQMKISATKSESAAEKYSELLLSFGTILSGVLENHLQEVYTKRNTRKTIINDYTKYLKAHSLTLDGMWPRPL